MEKLVVILLALPLFCNGQIVDRTLQPGAYGEDVVDAVMLRIRSTCILIDDKYMMKRIAAADTGYGATSSAHSGGIWKITQNILDTVKISCQTTTRQICNNILNTFSFDITMATMSTMDVPLYSALIMHIYITETIKTIPSTKDLQALSWVSSIRKSRNLQDFIEKSSVNVKCSAVKMELVFAVDGSGSVGSNNFQKALDFVYNVVQNLQIGPNEIRVALITFSTDTYYHFHLDAYYSKSTLNQTISSIPYKAGGTATHKALNMARTSIFPRARKYVPKVFVLVTDGKSNSKSDTIAEAEKLKMDDTTIFTIGLGHVNNQEMHAVASYPSCIHYYSLNSYAEIGAIIGEIQRASCLASVTVDITNTSQNGSNIDNNPMPSCNETKIQNVHILQINATNSQTLISIKVDVVCGTVNIYTSNFFIQPSEAFSTYSAIATDNEPGWIRSPINQLLYVSFVSQQHCNLSTCTNPHYNITINPNCEGVTVICKENGIERNCTVNEIKQSFPNICGDEGIPNPCTWINILNNIRRFKHPTSVTKYIQCKISGEMEIVTCPTGTKYDENQRVCGPQVICPTQNSILYNGSNPCTVEALRRRQFYFANPSDVSTFIQCNEWGTAFLVYCPVKTCWSQPAYTCVHNSSPITPAINPCKSSQNNQIYFPNPDNINSFIQCDESRNAFIMPCALGTVWSQAINKCDYPSNVISPTNYISTTPTAHVRCAYGQLVPHQSDPAKFYQCDWNGMLVEKVCSAGLIFSTTLKVCVWP